MLAVGFLSGAVLELVVLQELSGSWCLLPWLIVVENFVDKVSERGHVRAGSC